MSFTGCRPARAQDSVFDRVHVNGAGYIHGMVASPTVDANGYRPIYSRYDGAPALRRWVPDPTVPASEGGGYWRILGDGRLLNIGRSRGIAVPHKSGSENIVYFTMGSTTNRWDVQQEAGVYKSTDYGETYTKVLGITEGAGFGQTYLEGTNEASEGLYIDPNNTNVVYYGGQTWLENWNPISKKTNIIHGGLFRSLTGGDAGSWGQTTAPIGPSGSQYGPDEAGSGVLFVLIDGRRGTTTVNGATVSKRIYVGYRNQTSTDYGRTQGDLLPFDGGIYMSDDGGQTWAKIPGSPLNPGQIALAPSNGIYVTAMTGVFKFDGISKWTDITPAGKAGNAFTGLASDPEDRGRVIANGFISTNGGTSWSEQHKRDTSTNTQVNSVDWIVGPPQTDARSKSYGYAYPYSWPVFIPDSTADGKTPEVWDPQVFSTWKTNNIYASIETAGGKVQWQNISRNQEGEIPFTFWTPPSATASVKLYWGGADVKGFRTTDLRATHVQQMQSPAPGTRGVHGNQVTDINGGEARGADPAGNVKKIVLASPDSIAVSADEGVTFAGYTLPAAYYDTFTANTEVAVSATDPNKIVILKGDVLPYYATNAFSGSTNLNWAAGTIPLQKDEKNNDLKPKVYEGEYDHGKQLVADTVTGGKFYLLGQANGGFKAYVSTDGGATWTLAGPQTLPGRASRRGTLYAAPEKAGELWYGSGNEGGLWRSTDSGATWAKLETVAYARASAVGKAAPGNPNATVYVYGTVKLTAADTTTVTGAFRSTDNGATWVRIDDDEHRFAGTELMFGDRNVYGRVFLQNGTSPIIIDSAPQAGIRNLTANDSGNRQVTLRWGDVSSENRYKIERREGTSGSWMEIASALPANSTSFVDKGQSMGTLKRGVGYSYRIRWTNPTLASGWSNIASLSLK